MKTRVAILISGRGSNLQSLITAAAARQYPAEIALVLSNNPAAPGLARAEAAGIPTLAIDHRRHGRDRQSHEAELHAALQSHAIGLVCLAGYMRLLSPFFVAAWQGAMLNIHPSLLPAFPGLNTHERALAAGVALHGCTTHFVTETMDDGPIIGQAAVPVLASDTPETLAARVLAQEHKLYPATLAAVASATLPAPAPAAALSHLRRV